MTPERFHNLNGATGPWADAMSTETRTDHMGGAWIIYLTEPEAVTGHAPWREGVRHVVSMFGAHGVFEACQWVARLRRLEATG